MILYFNKTLILLSMVVCVILAIPSLCISQKWTEWKNVYDYNGGHIFIRYQQLSCNDKGVSGVLNNPLVEIYQNTGIDFESITVCLRGIRCSGEITNSYFDETNLRSGVNKTNYGNWHTFKSISNIAKIEFRYSDKGDHYFLKYDFESKEKKFTINGRTKEEIAEAKKKAEQEAIEAKKRQALLEAEKLEKQNKEDNNKREAEQRKNVSIANEMAEKKAADEKIANEKKENEGFFKQQKVGQEQFKSESDKQANPEFEKATAAGKVSEITNSINGIINIFENIQENKEQEQRARLGTAEGNLNYGNALYEKGDWDGAITAYRKAIELNPKYANAYNNLGVALLEKGDLDGAITAYRKDIELNPKHAYAYNNLGIALFKKGDLDSAITLYRKAIKLNRRYAIAYGNIGLVLSEKGDLDSAITLYRKAIKLNRKDAGLYNLLGLALSKKGDLDGAFTAYRKAIKLNRKYAYAYNNLGALYLTKGMINESKIEVNKSIELDTLNGYAFKNLGHIYLAENNLAMALQSYSTSQKLIKDDNKFLKEMNSDYKELNLIQYKIEEKDYIQLINNLKENR